MTGNLTIVEVGPGSFENMTGSGMADFDLKRSAARTVMLQAPALGKPVDSHYQTEEHEWEKLAPLLGVNLVYGDIYNPTSISIPPHSVGLWVLENVLTDPLNTSRPDFKPFSSLLKTTLAPGGIVLFRDNYRDKAIYEALRKSLVPPLSELLNEVLGSFIATPDKLPFIRKFLEPLCLVDPALEKGLVRHSPGDWVVYQYPA